MISVEITKNGFDNQIIENVMYVEGVDMSSGLLNLVKPEGVVITVNVNEIVLIKGDYYY